MAVIRIENLSKSYAPRMGVKQMVALQRLNLEVQAGEIFGFLGPNGAGKTTTINLLLNFIRPTFGTAYLFDQPVSDPSVHRRLGFLPESVNLHDYYTGRQLLEFYGELVGLEKTAMQRRVDQLIELLKLGEASSKEVRKYSKGMLQRLGFAQALLGDPDLLILDEPTSNLDPVGRKDFRDLILELKRQGKTIFISSHILAELEPVCDRVAILQKGELKRIGSLTELSVARSVTFILRRLPPELLENVLAASAEVTMANGQVYLRCLGRESQERVEQLLKHNYLLPERVEIEKQSLEEIFLSALKEEGRP